VTILVVDDDLSVMQLLWDYLTGEGYNVISASDGYSALAAFAQGKPRLVILDYAMPAGTGRDVLQRIRARVDGASVPVIFLTACPLAELQMRMPPSPIVRYLNKPVDFPKLAATIKELLGPGRDSGDDKPSGQK